MNLNRFHRILNETKAPIIAYKEKEPDILVLWTEEKVVECHIGNDEEEDMRRVVEKIIEKS